MCPMPTLECGIQSTGKYSNTRLEDICIITAENGMTYFFFYFFYNLRNYSRDLHVDVVRMGT